MAYKFTEKRNNIQEQTTYVIYMIVSSYFHKSSCNSRTLETSLYLHYLEMPKNRQKNLEKQVIRRSEQDLGEVMSVLSQMNCEVVFTHRDDRYYLDFETGFETVSVVVNQMGYYVIDVSM